MADEECECVMHAAAIDYDVIMAKLGMDMESNDSEDEAGEGSDIPMLEQPSYINEVVSKLMVQPAMVDLPRGGLPKKKKGTEGEAGKKVKKDKKVGKSKLGKATFRRLRKKFSKSKGGPGFTDHCGEGFRRI